VLEEWILALAASPFVYLALYLFATIDGFFPPMPSESAVIALAAVAMSTGAPNLWVVAGVAALGAFTGDQIAYAIGRRVQVRRTRLLRGRRAQRAVDWAEYALANRGASFIIGARYIPIGRVAVNMTAGALGFPRARFVGLTAIAAVSWAIYSTAIGIGAGAWLQGRPVVAVLVGVVAGTVIGLGVDWVLGQVQRRPHLRRLAQRRITQRRLAQRRLAQRGAAARRARAMRGFRGRARTQPVDGTAPAPGGPVGPVVSPDPDLLQAPAAELVLPGVDSP
jgi:membrane-associated protein